MTEAPAQQNGHHPPDPRPRWPAARDCAPVSPVNLGIPQVRSSTESAAGRGYPDRDVAALIRAELQASAVLVGRLGVLEGLCGEVFDSHAGALGAIEQVERHTASGSVHRALALQNKVLKRHADDGPEDRRDRRVWSWLPWAALLVSAVFDASFVGYVVSRFLSLGTSTVDRVLSYLPGCGLALGLLAAGTALAESLFRRRIAKTRSKERVSVFARLLCALHLRKTPPQPETREPEDLPWPRSTGPVLGATGLLVLATIWAYVRATTSMYHVTSLGSYEPAFVALLLLLSASTVALKVLSHNPYAKRSKEAEGALSGSRKKAEKLLREARARLSGHQRTWLRLDGALIAVTNEAQAIVEQACAVILDNRSGIAVAEQPAFPAFILDWPWDFNENTRDEAKAETPDSAGEVAVPESDPQAPTEVLSVPRAALDLGILGRTRKIVTDFDPAALEARLTAASNAVTEQLKCGKPDSSS